MTWAPVPPPRRLRDVPARTWVDLAVLVVLYLVLFLGPPVYDAVQAAREHDDIHQRDLYERPQEGSP